MEQRKFQEKTIPLSKVRIIRHRERDEEAFRELAESLKLIQIKAVLAQEARDGFYEVFSGEGRIRALQEDGQKNVRALVFPPGAIDEKEIFIEWIATNARRNAPPLDVARLMVYDKEKGLTLEEIAKKYGKRPATVRQKIRTIEKADPEVLSLVESGKIRLDQVQHIVGRVSKKEEQRAIAGLLKTGAVPAKDTAALVGKFKELKKSLRRLPKISELQKALRSLDSQKADLNETLGAYSTRLSYLENITTLVTDDVKFLNILTASRITFSDLQGDVL